MLHAMRRLQGSCRVLDLLPRVNLDAEVSKSAVSSSCANFANALDKFIVRITSTIVL